MKRVLVGVLISLACLAGLELSLRLTTLFFDWKVTDSGRDRFIYHNRLWQQQLFSNFLGVHQSDPLLLWEFKPHLHKNIFQTNSQGILGPEFQKQKPSGRFRILLLGDSSPVGLGLPRREEAFGEQFLQLLKETYPGRDLELINASVSGYTSAQGLVWFKKYGIQLEPDLLLLYFGNNDASFNGFLEDRQILPQSFWLSDLQHFLGRFAIYQALRGALIPLKERLLHRKRLQSEQLKLRVPAPDYFNNLKQIIEMAKQPGAQVLLTTIPVPREWPPAIEFKPFLNLKTKSGELIMPQESRALLSAQMAFCLDWSEIKQKYPQIDYWTLNVFRQVYSDSGNLDSSIFEYQKSLSTETANIYALNNLAVLFWTKKDYVKSLQFLTRALGQDSLNPVLHYNLGMTIKKLGDTLSALEEFHKAKELDFHSLRTKDLYNQKIKLLAQLYNLPLLDLDSLFLENNNEFLFIDHCHPTKAGHRLIAQALLEKIKETSWLEKREAR